MEWAGHGHGAAAVMNYDDMPGMATDEQMNALRKATGVQAEILFLEMMIDHHQGGVDMANAVLPLTQRSEVTYLADTIVAGQQAEIEAMQTMLSDRKALYDPA